jgi:hypothetical protein
MIREAPVGASRSALDPDAAIFADAGIEN